MAPRILLDLSVAPSGGAATYVAGFAHGLAESRSGTVHDIVAVFDAGWARGNPGLVGAVAESGVKVVAQEFPAPGTWAARLLRGRRLAAIVRAESVDVAFVPRDVAPALSVPFVTLARNLYAWEPFGSDSAVGGRLAARILRLQAVRSARSAAAVLAVSRPMAAVVRGPVDGVVHHGCLLPEHPRAESGTTSTTVTVAMVANLIESKGIEYVLRAVEAASRRGIDITLKIYGRRMDEAYATEMEALSEGLLGGSVFLGPRYGDDLVGAYQDADIVVVGSAFESFCHPLVEAMRSGCVVVAPDSELVEEICGDVAVTYRVDDAQDLAEALHRAASERHERSKLGIERSRRFRWGTTVEQTLDAVVTAVAPHRQVPGDEELTDPEGREGLRSVSVLWSRPSLYLDDCLDALARREVDVQVFYSSEGLAGVDAAETATLTDEARGRLLCPSTDLMLVGGWRNLDYLRLARRARRSGVTTVLAFDTQPRRQDLKMQLQLKLAGLVLRRLFSHVFVPGDRQAAVARRLGFPPHRVYTGLYACREQPTAGDDASPTQAPAFTWVGRLVPDKGVDLLVEAYRGYRSTVDDPWPLRVIGRGQEQHLVDGRVDGLEFLGAMGGEEVHSHLAESAALVSSSRYEPWGMVLAEAASHGVPVICTDAAGAGDHLVEDSRSGFVAPTGDVAALCGAMVDMHNLSTTERRALARRSLELSKQFTPALWVRQVIAIHRAAQSGAPSR